MSYVQQNLMKNEKVVYQADLHWWIFALPALLLIVGFIMVMSGGDVAGAGWALVIFGVIGFVLRWIKKVNSEFVVTNKRVILKQGLIKRNTNEIMLSKAEGMNVDQGIIGRILGFGSIVITSGGALNTYRIIKDPLRFRKEINEQIEENYATPVPAV